MKIIYYWWVYYWSKYNVWCTDEKTKRERWIGRINIFYGIHNLYKTGMIEFYKEHIDNVVDKC